VSYTETLDAAGEMILQSSRGDFTHAVTGLLATSLCILLPGMNRQSTHTTL